MHSHFSAKPITVLIPAILAFYAETTFGQVPPGSALQPPNINYGVPPQVYLANNPITTLPLKNTGGPVPVGAYGQVSTLATGLNTVTGVATDNLGNIYAESWGGNQIIKITAGGIKTVLAGSGAPGFADGNGTAATFNAPDGIVVNADGDMYVTDLNNNAIRKITSGGVVTTIAGGTQGSANGTGNAASFYSPRGLTLDAADNIYVADQGNNLIRKVTPQGVVTTFAGGGILTTFNTPTSVTIDNAGNFFVSDVGSGTVKKITPAGVVTTAASGLDFPRELHADALGNIYISCEEGQTINKISPDGVVSVLAGTNQNGWQDGPAKQAMFNEPIGLAVDGNGILYVGEASNSMVRKIELAGYSIDKPLPAGLIFDTTNGSISGTPTVQALAADYTVTAYNISGASSTVVNIKIIVPMPSVITFPPHGTIDMSTDNILHPNATSTNNQTPITYTSSNPAVAYMGPDGQIHLVAPGTTVITASQSGNTIYLPATSVHETYNIVKDQLIHLPDIAYKTICSADFATGATSSNTTIPLIYSSSNTAVATISSTGVIQVIGQGNTLITVSQSGNNLYNAAIPQTQMLTVNPLTKPTVTITPNYYSSCEGLSVAYYAQMTGEGIHPTYQWQLNGQNSGANTPTYTSNTLKSGDVLTCVVTNNDNCAPVASLVSNQASIDVYPNVTLSLVISASAIKNIIAGTPITFTAKPSANIQSQPSYSWYINGHNIGTNSAVFTTTQLKNADVISCIMASSGKCIVNPATYSNDIMVQVIPLTNEVIVVPNAFTPNGDGINDTWDIKALLALPQCSVNVYNRFGIVVYHSIGYNVPWDGRSSGKDLPVGTYYFIIDPKNDLNRISGQVTIIK